MTWYYFLSKVLGVSALGWLLEWNKIWNIPLTHPYFSMHAFKSLSNIPVSILFYCVFPSNKTALLMPQYIIASMTVWGSTAIFTPLILFSLFLISYFLLFLFYHSLTYILLSFVYLLSLYCLSFTNFITMLLLLACFSFNLLLLPILSLAYMYCYYYYYWWHYEWFRFTSHFFMDRSGVTFTTIRPNPCLYILNLISL